MSTQQTSAKVSSVSTSSSVKTEQKMERSEKVEKSKVDMIKEHQKSLEYGKNSRSSALRRAEIHAVNSGKDPRHVLVPRNHDDDICKKVLLSLLQFLSPIEFNTEHLIASSFLKFCCKVSCPYLIA